MMKNIKHIKIIQINFYCIKALIYLINLLNKYNLFLKDLFIDRNLSIPY